MEGIVDAELLQTINSVAPKLKQKLNPQELLNSLKLNNPQLVAEAQSYALSGFTIAAIGHATSLGYPAIEAILSERVPQELELKFKESLAREGQVVPERPVTYADVRTFISSRRNKNLVNLSDSTTKLRNVLVERALSLLNSGHGSSLREVISALRVVGVPAPGSVTDSPAVAQTPNKVPPRFIIDDEGRFTPNPDYQLYIAKGNLDGVATNTNVLINIQPTAYEMAGSAGVQSRIDADAQGNIISVTRNGGTRSLQSMGAKEVHKLARGEDSGISAASARIEVELDKLLEDIDIDIAI